MRDRHESTSEGVERKSGTIRSAGSKWKMGRINQSAGSTEKVRPMTLNACGNLRITMFASS
jgi:hypothetical protein